MNAIWTRINTALLVLVLLTMIAVVAVLATRAEGGPLDPSGTPGPSLPQVEPRNPIPPAGWNGTFPIVISQPGSYFLTRNLTGVSGQSGVRIDVDDVSLDLNGFALLGVAGSVDGVMTLTDIQDVTVTNGMVAEWGDDGIDLALGTQLRVEGVNARKNRGSGIELGSFSRVRDCIVDADGATFDNVTLGIVGVRTGATSVIEDCTTRGYGTGIATGDTSVVRRNAVSTALANGIYVANDSRVEGNSIRATAQFSSPVALHAAIYLDGSGNFASGNYIDEVGNPRTPNDVGVRVIDNGASVYENYIENVGVAIQINTSVARVYRNRLRFNDDDFAGAGEAVSDIAPYGTLELNPTNAWLNFNN